jgi:hypothetical protein
MESSEPNNEKGQKLPTLCKRRKGWGTRKFKFKGKTKTNQLQDELPEWYHPGRREVNCGKYGYEKVGHPPAWLAFQCSNRFTGAQAMIAG